MKKTLLLALAATAFVAVPAAAQDMKAKSAPTALQKANKERMAKILADPSRAEDAKRDKYRHPAETFAFFRINPDHKVGEYSPGGEWISRTLGRYMDEKGTVAGLFTSIDLGLGNAARHEQIIAAAAKYPEDVAKVTGRPASDFKGFSLSAIPEGEKGTFDRIIVMRALHGTYRSNIADAELKRMRDLLKPDGLLGVEQHRAKPNSAYSYSDGTKGYLREADVIKMLELAGFELVAKSEINANPKDTANYPDGVWTLPPVLTLKDQDRAKYEAIGESDRMTLLFRKRP